MKILLMMVGLLVVLSSHSFAQNSDPFVDEFVCERLATLEPGTQVRPLLEPRYSSEAEKEFAEKYGPTQKDADVKVARLMRLIKIVCWSDSPAQVDRTEEKIRAQCPSYVVSCETKDGPRLIKGVNPSHKWSMDK